MRILIAGATGVLGRRVLKLLVAKDYDVIALSRSPQNTEWLEKNKATPHSGDIFDEESLCKAVSGCDVVLHLATAIPTKVRTSIKDWRLNDRIRRQGTEALVGAALRNRCQLYVQQSITLIYGDQAGKWADEATPPPEKQVSILQSAQDMERIVQTVASERGLESIILRFGAFYCYDSAHTQSMFAMAQRGRLPVIGAGQSFSNVVSGDDAASAVVGAIENHQHNTGEIFNVCDDEPVTFRDLADFVAKTLDARRPFRIPKFLARLTVGSHAVDTLVASVRCKNEKMKQRLGWKPRYPTYREGYRAEIEKWLHLQ